MKNNNKAILTLSLLCFCISVTQAQESLQASGGNATGSGGNVTYTIGQVAYSSSTASTGSVTQGIQQTYEILTLQTNDKAFGISLTAFPNPTTDYLTLDFQDYSAKNLEYIVFDTQGRILKNNEITSKQTAIDMQDLPAAMYFINIMRAGKKIKTFKIVKKQ